MGIGEFFMYIWLKLQFKREFFHIPSQHFFVGKSRITPFPKARAKAVAPQQPQQHSTVAAAADPSMLALWFHSLPHIATAFIQNCPTSWLEKLNLSQIISFLIASVLGLSAPISSHVVNRLFLPFPYTTSCTAQGRHPWTGSQP